MATHVKIEITNMKKFRKGFRQVKDSLAPGQMLAAVRAAENQAIAYTKVNIVNHNLVKTGNLLGSVQEDSVERGTDKVYVTFGPHVVYAAIHEFGGVIHATTARGLVFQYKGHWYRKQSVTIPARPYLRPTFDQHESELLKIMFDYMRGKVAPAWAKP